MRGLIHDPERYWVSQANRGFLSGLSKLLKPEFLLTRDTDIALHKRFGGLAGFVHAILELSALNIPVLMGATVLLHRLVSMHPDLPITTGNIYRVTMAALAVADKLLDDHYMPNVELARALGIPTTDLNDFELEFLEILNYDAFIDRQAIVQIGRQWGMEGFLNIA